MIATKRHPSWRELNRLADDELDADARRAALEHVAGCPRCSANVSLLNDLREAGREMRHPSPPKDLLDDVLRDRAQGLRTILPAVPPSPRPGRRLLPAAAAVAVIASLAGLATLTLTSEAGAGASELSVNPALPLPGEEIRMGPGNGLSATGPGPQLLAHPAELHPFSVLHEIDNGPVIGIVAHREVNPMAILAAGDHHLVPVIVAHHRRVARAGLPVQDIAEGGRILGQIDLALECFQFVHAAALSYTPPIRSAYILFPTVRCTTPTGTKTVEK